MNPLILNLATEADTEHLGFTIAAQVKLPCTIFLKGDLGAGKTRLSRAILHGLGHEGSVKSPTYTLVEPYQIDDTPIYHFDLYRLTDPTELEYIGIRDYFNEPALFLIEWPAKGYGMLNQEDLTIELRILSQTRECVLTATTEVGEHLLQQLKENL